MIPDYESALVIAQDRANRTDSIMFLFHVRGGGYYLSTIYEQPFVYEFLDIEQTEVISPQDDWMDELMKKARH